MKGSIQQCVNLLYCPFNTDYTFFNWDKILNIKSYFLCFFLILSCASSVSSPSSSKSTSISVGPATSSNLKLPSVYEALSLKGSENNQDYVYFDSNEDLDQILKIIVIGELGVSDAVKVDVVEDNYISCEENVTRLLHRYKISDTRIGDAQFVVLGTNNVEYEKLYDESTLLPEGLKEYFLKKNAKCLSNDSDISDDVCSVKTAKAYQVINCKCYSELRSGEIILGSLSANYVSPTISILGVLKINGKEFLIFSSSNGSGSYFQIKSPDGKTFINVTGDQTPSSC